MRHLTGRLEATSKLMGSYGWPSSITPKMSLLLVAGIFASLSTANPTNPIQPVFIQRDLPPAPYAYGLQDFDSSEEVTIVKRAGQTVYTPSSTTHLTTPPQALPTPLAQVQTATSAQPLQVPLSLQQLQKPSKLSKKAAALQEPANTAATVDTVSTTGAAATAATVPGSSQSEPKQSTTSKGSPEQISLMEVELESAPRPEDLPQPAELSNAIPQKRNVYSNYAAAAQPNGCACGGYVLVEKKIYVCEPKETVVRLMKRSHDDDCTVQETQHVGCTADNPQQMFQLIPMPEQQQQ